MSEKVCDLEERTFQFAKSIRLLAKKLPKTPANIEDVKQVIRSSGSIGANYIEANEALSKKDFLILETNEQEFSNGIRTHFDEATELKKILSAIISKSN